MKYNMTHGITYVWVFFCFVSGAFSYMGIGSYIDKGFSFSISEVGSLLMILLFFFIFCLSVYQLVVRLRNRPFIKLFESDLLFQSIDFFRTKLVLSYDNIEHISVAEGKNINKLILLTSSHGIIDIQSNHFIDKNGCSELANELSTVTGKTLENHSFAYDKYRMKRELGAN